LLQSKEVAMFHYQALRCQRQENWVQQAQSQANYELKQIAGHQKDATRH
jgi:hypothetical protein